MTRWCHAAPRPTRPGSLRVDVTTAAEPESRRAARVVATLVLALAAGAAARALDLPLPWMIGPLLATAAAGMLGWRQVASQRLRNAGQWSIGVALGLAFTPETSAVVGRLAPALLAGAAWALTLGWGFHRWLRWRHPDATTATTWYAAAIGGASEMAVLAGRHGARLDHVAAAHSLRVMLVVVAVPFAMRAWGVQGIEPDLPLAEPATPAGFAWLVAITAPAVLMLRHWRLPNPYVLGALLAAAIPTAAGVPLPTLPAWAPAAGQVFIGASLGARFTPESVLAAPRWMTSVALGTAAMLAASAGVAALGAWLVGLAPAAVVLGTSPGGIAEMCITAQALHLAVPVVTAFHLTRYIAVLLLTEPLFLRERRRLARATDG